MDSCFALIGVRQHCVAKICNASPKANAFKLQNDPFTISSSILCQVFVIFMVQVLATSTRQSPRVLWKPCHNTIPQTGQKALKLQWATKVLRHLAIKWSFERLGHSFPPPPPFPPNNVDFSMCSTAQTKAPTQH